MNGVNETGAVGTPLHPQRNPPWHFQTVPGQRPDTWKMDDIHSGFLKILEKMTI